MPEITLIHGDSIKLLRDEHGFRNPFGKLLRADVSITDPPYGIDFTEDRSWDSFGITSAVAARPGHAFEMWVELWARPLFADILLPGAYIAAFSAERMIHRLTSGIENAGFDIAGGMAWIYATGQVKSKNRIKPAYEPIALGRKGSESKTLAAIFEKDGRGLLHTAALAQEDGKHPSNLIVEESVADDEELQGGEFFYVAKPSPRDRDYGCETLDMTKRGSALSGTTVKCADCGVKLTNVHKSVLDSPCSECGGKMVYSRGVSSATGLARNFHPTVKPISLMRRIVKLLTKPGHTIIDPFMGSGTTGVAAILEGRNFIGIERDDDYRVLYTHRLAQACRDIGDNEQADRLLGGLHAQGSTAMET